LEGIAPSSAEPEKLRMTIHDVDTTEPIRPDDRLFGYVFLDPERPPQAFVIEWATGDSPGGLAAWGEESNVRVLMGETTASYRTSLPQPGEWVRLEVPANLIGLGRDEKPLTAITIHQLDGVAYWDRAGLARPENGGPVQALGDMMWALLTSPEFQYIR
jgi:hypothetical protein